MESRGRREQHDRRIADRLGLSVRRRGVVASCQPVEWMDANSDVPAAVGTGDLEPNLARTVVADPHQHGYPVDLVEPAGILRSPRRHRMGHQGSDRRTILDQPPPTTGPRPPPPDPPHPQHRLAARLSTSNRGPHHIADLANSDGDPPNHRSETLDRMVMLYEDMVSTSPQLAYRPSSQLG